MNMSDDVTGIALQISMHTAEKGIELGEKAIDQTIDNIAELLKALGTFIKDLRSTKLSDIKSGEVSIKKLIGSARKNGDTISTSENAISDEDMKIMKKKAKEYGIPVAFTGKKNKENIYANVRTSDLPIFQRICTEIMKEKLAERPQELGNFKVNKWEIPYITSELNNYDLSAQFGKTKSGDCFCLYEKADEKAIMIARNEFVRKCNELKENLTVTKDENFFVIKDKNANKEISFETVPTKEELSEQMQNNFGYDKNKADIACAKFGEENLQGEMKEKFFSKNPQNKFSEIDTNITVKGESIFTKEYTCWRVIPKSDNVPRIVFQNENGNFAVLNPTSMTKSEMADILKTHLQIQDSKTIDALIDKAEKVSDYYSKHNENNFTHNMKFDETQLLHDEYGKLLTYMDSESNSHQIIPQNVSNTIERNGKDEFAVTSTVKGIDYVHIFGGNSEDRPISDTKELKLSFSDKKNSLNQLAELYKKQGIPEDIAKQMSKDVFAKAEMQSAEKVIQIEEIRAETQNNKTEFKMNVKSGNRSEEVDITDKDKAVNEISEKFGVSEDIAEIVVNRAQENITESRKIIVSDEEDFQKDNQPETDYNENEIPPMPDRVFDDSDVPPEMPNFDDVPDIDIPVKSGRGGR